MNLLLALNLLCVLLKYRVEYSTLLYFFISVSDSYVADVEAYVLFYRLVEYLRLSCKKGG